MKHARKNARKENRINNLNDVLKNNNNNNKHRADF